MTDREKTYMTAIIAVVVLLIVFLILKRRPVDQVMGPVTQSGSTNYYSSYFQTNPGVNDTTTTGSSGTTYTSTADITVQTFGLNALSKQFIPMFGLVGMTAVGA